MYPPGYHPHEGDARVDPQARRLKDQVKHEPSSERQELIGESSEFFDADSLPDSQKAYKPDSSDKYISSSYKIEYSPNPRIPVSYVWVNGEFYTGPLGSEVGEFAGRLEGRVKIVSPGKKLKIAAYNGVGSINGRIIEVVNPNDRQFLGKAGWWETKNLSKETKKARQGQEGYLLIYFPSSSFSSLFKISLCFSLILCISETMV